jgi:hypothetical protein
MFKIGLNCQGRKRFNMRLSVSILKGVLLTINDLRLNQYANQPSHKHS